MSKTSNLVSALVVACTVALAAPAVAAAASGPAPAAVQGHKKHHAKLEAKAEKSRVKVGETTKIKGSFADLGGQESVAGGEPVIVQQLEGGVWVDLSSDSCEPDGYFVFSLSFSIQASLTLRVYHPETDLYASAVSNVFALVVI